MRIPATIADVHVSRAWPHGPADEPGVTFEGRDDDGALRAGIWSETHVECLPTRTDPRLPALTDAPGELVGHRYGKRAVLRDGDRFLKVVREKKAADVVARGALGAGAAREAGFLAAEPRLEAPGVVATDRLPGAPLDRPDGLPWEQLWVRFAECWPRFAAQTAVEAPAHTGADEARVLREWVLGAIARGVLPDPEGRAATTVERIAAQLEAGDAEPVLAHRDLHEGQLLVGDDGDVALLDLDTLALADPALDLGNLAVHAIWRVAAGQWRKEAADAVLHAVMAACGHLEVSPARLQLAQSATALRMAAVHAYRPASADFAARWLEVWLTKPVLR